MKNKLFLQSSLNKNVVLFSLAVTLVAYWSILRSPLLYVDDALRVYTFESINQGVHGRPYADIIYKLFTNGIFIDISPLSQIIALLCITWAGHLTNTTFTDPQPYPSSMSLYVNIAAVTMFSTFPLNYSIISYKFDSLSFGFAVLSAIYAFKLIAKNEKDKKATARSVISASILLSITLGIYQPMYGFFLCTSIMFVCNLLLKNEKNIHIIVYCSKIFISTLLSGIFYLPIFIYTKYQLQLGFHGLGPHPYVSKGIELPTILTLTPTVYENVKYALKSLYNYSGANMPTLTLFIITVFFLHTVIQKNILWGKKFAIFFLLPIAIIMCFGIQLILVNPTYATRTTVSFAAFFTCMTIIVLIHSPGIMLKKIAIAIALTFSLSSSTILTAIGNAQRDQYNYQNDILYNGLGIDLLQLYYTHGLRKIYLTNINEPMCTSLQILELKYDFLRNELAMSGGLFVMQKYIAELPINYKLIENLNPTEFNRSKPIVQKPNYIIHETLPGTFAITLKNVASIPFSYDRWK